MVRRKLGLMMSKLWKNFLSEKFEDFKISISVDEVEPEEVVVIPNDVLRTVFKLFFSHFAYIYSIIKRFTRMHNRSKNFVFIGKANRSHFRCMTIV